MTDIIARLQKALDEYPIINERPDALFRDSLAALQAALAHQREPVDGFGGNLDSAFDAEPVAWRRYSQSHGWMYEDGITAFAVDPSADALYLTPTIPEGWQLVPKVPTAEMLPYLCDCDTTTNVSGAVEAYKAMLAAVKEPK